MWTHEFGLRFMIKKNINKWKNIAIKFIFHHEFQTGLIKKENLWKEQPFGELALYQIIYMLILFIVLF